MPSYTGLPFLSNCFGEAGLNSRNELFLYVFSKSSNIVTSIESIRQVIANLLTSNCFTSVQVERLATILCTEFDARSVYSWNETLPGGNLLKLTRLAEFTNSLRRSQSPAGVGCNQNTPIDKVLAGVCVCISGPTTELRRNGEGDLYGNFSEYRILS